MTKRFVSWAAVSSLPQAKKVSLEDQLATNRHHVEQHGGVLVEELVVPGESRLIVLFEDACRRIEAYDRLRQLIDQRAFDVLVYLDRGRLGRKASLSMAIVELCHDAGIVCYETENPPHTLEPQRSFDDLIVGAVKSIGYQREVEKLKLRRQMGMEGRVRKGHFPAAVPYGWKERYDEDGNKSIVLHDEQAEVVRTILVDMYLKRGWGEPQIVKELNERGVPAARGGTWATSTISSMLKMVLRYGGWTELNVQSRLPYIRERGNWPPILTDEEVEAIRVERQSRAKAKRSVNSGHRFSRVVWCRRCDRPMALDLVQNQYRKRYQMVRCRDCTSPKKTVRIEKVEAALRRAVVFLFETENRQAVLDSAPSRREELEAAIAQHEATTERLHESMKRADDAFVAGYMDSERYQRQLDRLKAQVAAAGVERVRLEALLDEEQKAADLPDRLLEIAQTGLAMLDDADISMSNAWIRRHFRVWVENGEVVEVEYL